MPVIGFRQRFVPAVRSGAKRQTVRAMRKRPFRPGDTLYLYEKFRTKGARLIRREICRGVDTVFVGDPWLLVVGGQKLDHRGRQAFAEADGFDSFEEFRAFLEEAHELPFEGQVIRW